MPRLTRHYAFWPATAPREPDWKDSTLWENLARAAARWPERNAMVYFGRVWRYGDLVRDIEAVAGWIEHGGITRGDRVLLYLQNSPQFVVAYHAVLRAGGVVVPVNPMNRQAELENLVADTGARLAICGQELLPHVAPSIGAGLDRILVATCAEAAEPGYDLDLPETLAGLRSSDVNGEGLVRWSDALAQDLTPSPFAGSPDDLAVIPYSSGTTGQPKGCQHTHRSVLAACMAGHLWNPTDENDVHLVSLPLFHVTGMQASMNAPLMAGGCLVIMTRWNTRLAAELISRFRVTRWRSIATMMIDLLNDPGLARYDLSSLTAVGGGGASMPEAIAARLRNVTGLEYIEGYGLSETMAGTHINPPARPKRQCLGIPITGVDSRIVSLEDGRELGPGEAGEIVTHAPQVFTGYWNNPEATRAAFMQIDGKPFFRTGDIGYYDDEGYFFITDRLKRMINVSGFKVWPAEVEALMLHHPQIAEACIVAGMDDRRGEIVRAHVVRAKGSLISEAEVIDWCRSEMAAYKCPASVVFAESLPRSGAGKVLWRELQARERDHAPGEPQ